MNSTQHDVVIVGSGAGGGSVAQGLVPLVEAGRRVLVLEQGPRLLNHEFTGREIEMAPQLYHSGGGFLTADGTMTLAFAQVYGGSTVVYSGTSLTAPERVIRQWDVPGLTHEDLARRSPRRRAPAPHHHRRRSSQSYFIDRAAEEGFVLETCMYFPFTTAKALVGFGAAHGG